MSSNKNHQQQQNQAIVPETSCDYVNANKNASYLNVNVQENNLDFSTPNVEYANEDIYETADKQM